VIRAVDAVLLNVPDLDLGLAFYRDLLGHTMLWRTATQAALAMPDSSTELVLTTDHSAETDLLVDDLDAAVARVERHGGRVVAAPADIPVGRLAVVLDPFGNQLVFIELSKGRYHTNDKGDVLGVA